jgi:2-polyprenyl-3-methyl-5-hydroxy-6-metoxy-1,4-benzoquinol methylase
MVATTPFLASSKYTASGLRGAHVYLLPDLLNLSDDLPRHARVLDVGCGNGSVTLEFAKRGHSVVGIDLSEAGIRIARET